MCCQEPLHSSLLCPGILAGHGRVANGPLDIERGDRIQCVEGLIGGGSQLILLVTQLLDDQRQGKRGLLGEDLRILSRQSCQEMVEGSEANIDDGGMLRRGGGAQTVKKLRDAKIRDVMLFDSGLDGVDILGLCIEGLVAAEDGDEVGGLLLGELAVGHERAC